ncbi:MAG TPA: polysaccharide deacetylase family protein [Steroidobacteraceae bacterium]|nr:polysaccharide deacetylase family protein [Steroidobacteraceae bacterium]
MVSPRGDGARLSVLMYHRVVPEADALTGEVDARSFDVQLRVLRDCFNVLPLAEAVELLAAGRLPSRAVAITFDDGYADNESIALPMLQQYRLPATFYIADGYLNGGRMFNDSVIESVRRTQKTHLDASLPGLPALPVGSLAEKQSALRRLIGHVKYLPLIERDVAIAKIAHASAATLPDDLMMRDEQVRRLADAGMDIGGHTVNHPILASIDLEAARNEIETNRRTLTTLTGRTPTMFAYPNGVPRKDFVFAHADIVRTAGYRAAVTTSWGAARHGQDLFQLPRFTPWDREPKRFAVRLMQNIVRNKPDILTSDTAG